MPLHPQAAEFLRQCAALDAPPVEQTTPEQARRAIRGSTAGLGPPRAVAKTEDLRIPGPAGDIPLRVYYPRDAVAPLPAIVFFHGGGWVVGDLDTHDGMCRNLTHATGSVVVAVDYRLAPEHKYPAAAEDAYAATDWVYDHAANFGVDRGRLTVLGDSAGGNLAAVVALMARDRGRPFPTAQVLLYPITDCDFDTPSYRECAEGYMLTRSAMRWYFRQYFAREADTQHPYFCPARAEDLSGLPPALVITAEYDPLRDEGEAYASKLRAAGVPTRLTRYDGQIHGFVRRAGAFDAASAAVGEIAAFLKEVTARMRAAI